MAAMSPKHSDTPGEPATSGEPATAAVPESTAGAEPPRLAKGTRQDVSDQAGRAAGLLDGVSALVHDLKNPLSAIVLETRMIELALEVAAPETRQRLARLAHNAIYIERLVNELLDLVASDADRLDIRRERIELAALIHDTIERAVPPGERARVVIEIRDAPAIIGDALRLERVLANLVDNALKHTAPGTTITVRLEERAGCACVSVKDRGGGLTAPEVQACFERFHRGPGEREGHGLGLYICRKILEAHRGGSGSRARRGRARGSTSWCRCPRTTPSCRP